MRISASPPETKSCAALALLLEEEKDEEDNDKGKAPFGSLFVLSGEELTLPQAEISALVETYAKNFRITKLSSRIIATSVSNTCLIRKIADRAAYCRFGGSFVEVSKNLARLGETVEKEHLDPSKSFAVSSFSLSLEECGTVGANIKAKTGLRVSLENPDYLLQAEKIYDNDDDGYILGLSEDGYKEFSWRARRPRVRKFFLPSAIYPKLARALVNLSRVKEGDFFLDPFCGTGSLLIESSLMGMRSLGVDITRWIARGAKLNLNGFSLPFDSVIRAESSAALPFTHVDGIATDVPYGRASSTKGLSTKELLERFLNISVSLCLNSTNLRKGFCVVMHPSTVKLEEISAVEDHTFHLKEQHLLYVHRNLTRAISILEKKRTS